MAARIARELGVQATLVPGGRGIFDVLVDGSIVFSKSHEGDFPDEKELVEELRGLRR